jgi:hypothetical protein
MGHVVCLKSADHHGHEQKRRNESSPNEEEATSKTKVKVDTEF